MAGTGWRDAVAQTIQRTRSYAPGAQVAIIAAIVAILASGLRLAGLTSITPGFRVDEATTGLMAQRISSDNLPILFGQERDALPPFFPYIVKLTGSLTGWGIAGPRVAAALCGIIAAVSAHSGWPGRWAGLEPGRRGPGRNQLLADYVQPPGSRF
ncbi:MAG: hypothetical protein R2849_16010 [Thermomicrobiales bacterium]